MQMPMRFPSGDYMTSPRRSGGSPPPKAPTPDDDDYRNSVREVQTFLRQVSFNNNKVPLVAVDGIYGSETTAAVTMFQKEYGLPPTGTVDKQTWDLLYAEYQRILRLKAPPTAVQPYPEELTALQPGDQGDAVVILQLMLNSINRKFPNVRPVQVSGVYDDATMKSVRDVQEKSDLPPNGLTDRPTWNAVADAYNVHR